MSHKPPWGVIVRPGLNSHVVWKEPSAEYLRSWGQFNQTLYRVNTEPEPWPQPWPPPKLTGVITVWGKPFAVLVDDPVRFVAVSYPGPPDPNAPPTPKEKP